MATTVEKYVGKCQEVVDAKPTYKNGASSLTECDCIGMDKYAFRECGVSFSTTGTNYSVRKQVDGLRQVVGTSDMNIGDVVFKAREPGESGYDLPDKYKEGGKEYNGDLRDYYHIGTVKSVYPLEIIHMTSPTAKTDTKIGKWGFVASWKKQFIKDAEPQPEPEPEPQPEPQPEPEPVMPAVVTSENNRPVNLRDQPSIYAQLVDRVPVGEAVDVLENQGEWCHVTWNRKTGYMMTKFLDFSDDAKPTLRRGSSGAFVEELQIDLLMLGYDIGTAYADGKFGKGTETAVMAFQQAHGLNPDGVAGKATWTAIYESLPAEEIIEDSSVLYTVTIEHLTAYQAEALKNRFIGASVIKEGGE